MGNEITDHEAGQKVSLQQSDLGTALMARLAAMYGSRWMAQFSNDKMNQLIRVEWTNVASYLSREDIERGLKRCMWIQDWPPSTPEFLRLALDLPDADLAARRAITGDLCDPISQAIVDLIGAQTLGMMTEHNALMTAKGLYSSARERVMEGLK